jgi:Methyltransferase domain
VIPSRLIRLVKPWLLPIWNGGHRFAWRIGELAGALGHGRFEWCSVCGRFGPMLRRNWLVAPELRRRWGLNDRQVIALAAKETDCCLFCGAQRRSRRMAEVILRLLPTGDRSIRGWVRSPLARALRIAEINEVTGLHGEFACLPLHQYSEYLPDVEPGSERNRVRCEDLMRLTYSDASLDLIVHAETLEHVPDMPRALSELNRVLAPGGLMVFTIPRLPDIAQTYSRARVGIGGKVEPIVEPLISHPGGDWGYPVFTEFGADFEEILLHVGFRVETFFGPLRDDELGLVYVASKVDS